MDQLNPSLLEKTPFPLSFDSSSLLPASSFTNQPKTPSASAVPPSSTQTLTFTPPQPLAPTTNLFAPSTQQPSFPSTTNSSSQPPLSGQLPYGKYSYLPLRDYPIPPTASLPPLGVSGAKDAIASVVDYDAFLTFMFTYTFNDFTNDCVAFASRFSFTSPDAQLTNKIARLADALHLDAAQKQIAANLLRDRNVLNLLAATFSAEGPHAGHHA